VSAKGTLARQVAGERAAELAHQVADERAAERLPGADSSATAATHPPNARKVTPSLVADRPPSALRVTFRFVGGWDPYMLKEQFEQA
jgi:hypothetical protein